MEGGDSLKNSLSWLHGVINGKIGHGLEAIVLQGLRVVHAEKGFMRFDFVVPNAVSEHVEIESKVNANRGKLMHVVVEVRRKGNGEVIAEGKLWMAANKLTLAQVSKL
ncbi:Thioesterase superfamily [Gossypium australe]|uniref:Thioesterase superfamily n=1 Tax=Gossypium australe TaxID=47621 RepID=A0A5B6UGA5_9ROSI|nr:Thioesterase superfamily [Gossypium australe]